MTYAIAAEVSREEKGGWTAHRSIPTFYLNANVQGITGADHAARIAREIIDPFNVLNVSVAAYVAS